MAAGDARVDVHGGRACNEAGQVVPSLSATRDSRVDFSFSPGGDVHQSVPAIAAPVGAGTAEPVAEVKADGLGTRRPECSGAWPDETEISQGQNTTRAARLRPSGHLDDSTKPLTPAIGRR
ncbi:MULTISPECIES: hypothetical protein [unclassified Nonomuraea]|uniref:hypothetical protein n=1 Tax=unclassified Nonomuraea TaxID=2593643 RepID=UPI0034038151